MSLRPSLRIRPRSLRGPILAALALIVVVVAGMFAMMVMSVRSLDAVSKAQRRTSAMTQETLQLERTVVDLETGVRGFMLTDDELPGALPPRPRASSALSLAELADLSEPPTDATVRAITLHLNDYVRDYTEPLIQGTRRPSVLAATTEGKQRLDALRGRVRHAQRPAAGDHPRAPRDLAGPAPAHAVDRRRRRRRLGRAARAARLGPQPPRPAARSAASASPPAGSSTAT